MQCFDFGTVMGLFSYVYRLLVGVVTIFYFHLIYHNSSNKYTVTQDSEKLVCPVKVTKRRFEYRQLGYRRTHMPKCDAEVQSNFMEITLRHGFSAVNLLHIFRAPFPEKLLLKISKSRRYFTCLTVGNVLYLRVLQFTFTVQNLSGFSIVLYQTVTLYVPVKPDRMISTLFLLTLKGTALIDVFD